MPIPAAAEVGDDPVAVVVDGDRVLVEDVGPTGRDDRRRDRQVGERRVVARRDRLATGGIALELVELAEPDRGRQIGQPEVVAERLVVVALTHALVAIEPEPVGQAVVVGRDQAAFAGRHVLRAVQAERAVSEAPHPPTTEGRPVGLAGILDDRQAVALGDGGDRRHVGRQAEQVDRADGPRSGRDRGLDPARVDQVRVAFDVDEDRRRAGRQDRADGRVERMADRDDLVARPEAEALEDAHQRHGPVADRDRVLDADERGEPLLELGDAAPAGEHPALQHLGDGGDLLGADVRPGDRDHASAPGPSAGAAAEGERAICLDRS